MTKGKTEYDLYTGEPKDKKVPKTHIMICLRCNKPGLYAYKDYSVNICDVCRATKIPPGLALSNKIKVHD